MFDFVRHRALFYLVSALIIVPGLISLVLPGGLRPGIDFTGGAVMTLNFEQLVKEDALRDAFSRSGHAEAVVQHTPGTNEFVVRTRPLVQAVASADEPVGQSERRQLEATLTQEFGPSRYSTSTRSPR
jgi:preprotein translocase subunit SecF